MCVSRGGEGGAYVFDRNNIEHASELVNFDPFENPRPRDKNGDDTHRKMRSFVLIFGTREHNVVC